MRWPPRRQRPHATRAGALAQTLERERDRDRDRAFLFRDLATLREDIALFDSVDDLRWRGPTAAYEPFAARLKAAVTAAGPRKRSSL
jgi:hypothetical protein